MLEFLKNIYGKSMERFYGKWMDKFYGKSEWENSILEKLKGDFFMG
jgi:hypothetical protein